VDSRHGVWAAIGGALLVVGVGGIIALIVSAQTSQRWFGPVVLLMAVAIVIGLYGLFGPILGLPMPAPRSEPFWHGPVALPTPTRSTSGAAGAATDVPPLTATRAGEPDPKPTTSARRRTTADGRPLISRTPEELMAMYGKLTDVQGKLLIAPFLEKWIQIEGTVQDVSSRGDIVRVDINEHPYVKVWFRQTDLPKLILLESGDHVTVHGRIEAIERYSVSLDPCVLVED